VNGDSDLHGKRRAVGATVRAAIEKVRATRVTCFRQLQFEVFRNENGVSKIEISGPLADETGTRSPQPTTGGLIEVRQLARLTIGDEDGFTGIVEKTSEPICAKVLGITATGKCGAGLCKISRALVEQTRQLLYALREFTLFVFVPRDFVRHDRHRCRTAFPVIGRESAFVPRIGIVLRNSSEFEFLGLPTRKDQREVYFDFGLLIGVNPVEERCPDQVLFGESTKRGVREHDPAVLSNDEDEIGGRTRRFSGLSYWCRRRRPTIRGTL
jgi:hypothetical protein